MSKKLFSGFLFFFLCFSLSAQAGMKIFLEENNGILKACFKQLSV